MSKHYVKYYVEYFVCGDWQLFGTYGSEVEAEYWAEIIRINGREARVGKFGE